jgi:hypothetical protein
MSGHGDGQPHRRAARRYDIRVPVEYEQSPKQPGSGTTWNLSVSGVLIEHASEWVEVGGRLELRFSFFAGSFDTRFPANVVRRTPDGFAVQFDILETDQIRLLNRALPGDD